MGCSSLIMKILENEQFAYIIIVFTQMMNLANEQSEKSDYML